MHKLPRNIQYLNNEAGIKPRQKTDKQYVQEADHVKKADNAVIVAKREDKAYSDDEWAKDKSTLSVSRPIEEEVLKDCVTETKEQPLASN